MQKNHRKDGSNRFEESKERNRSSLPLFSTCHTMLLSPHSRRRNQCYSNRGYHGDKRSRSFASNRVRSLWCWLNIQYNRIESLLSKSIGTKEDEIRGEASKLSLSGVWEGIPIGLDVHHNAVGIRSNFNVNPGGLIYRDFFAIGQLLALEQLKVVLLLRADDQQVLHHWQR